MNNNFKQKEINKHVAVVNRMFSEMVRNGRVSALMNPLCTTEAILAKLSASAGLHKDTKNFHKIVMAVANGYNVLDVLNNPELAGIAPSQRKWVNAFLAENKLPKTLVAPTRASVISYAVDINNAVIEDDKVVAIAKEQRQSQSDLSDKLAKAPVADEKGRLVADMKHIAVVNLAVPLPEDGDIDEETAYRLEVQSKMIDEGFYINGVKYVFLLQSASQARLLQAVFVAEDFMTIPAIFRKLGHDFKAYAKMKNNAWKLDITKMLKRFGLSATNTIASNVVRFDNAKVEVLPNGERKVVSDQFSIYVAEDRHVTIKEGKFKAFDKATKQILEFDASEKPVTLTVGDGMLLCDESIYWALMAEFGEKSDAWQIRLTPFGKGLMVFVPGLRKYYDANIVAFQSAVKGDFANLETNEDGTLKHQIQLRIARFNKPMQKKAPHTVFPYQFTHITSLTFEDMRKIVQPHLDKLLDVLKDPSIMQKYAGVAQLENMSKLEDAEKQFLTDRSISTTFAAFMHLAPFTFKDAYMQAKAIQLINNELDHWKAGTIPVEGHYRFLVHDPYALLEAGRIGKRVDGKLIVPNNVGLKANTAFMFNREGSVITYEIALFRNPAITKGEGRIVKGAAPQNYVMASTKGAFQNLAVMSVHDFNLFAMGGADVDGDESLTVTEKIIIKSLMRKNALPVLDLTWNGQEWISGCPFNPAMKDVPELAAACVKQDAFTIEFTDEQYTDEFINAVHELSKDFVKRTMKPNKIGYLTNIATKLADAVRKIGYMIMESVDKNGNKVKYADAQIAMMKKEIIQYETWIDLLRLCQGWEIDRAKHGGAYEEELALQLDFIKNPPEYASFEKDGKKLWVNPDWLRIHKGRTGGKYTNSVLSKLSRYIRQWVRDNVEKHYENMMKDIENNNILDVLNNSFAINPDRRDRIADKLKSIKFIYNQDIARIMEAEREMILAAELKYAEGSEELELAMEEANKTRRAAQKEVVAMYSGLVTALESAYTPEEIGYTAYWMTYTGKRTYVDAQGNEKQKSIAFPWTICTMQLLTLCAKIAGREINSKVADKFAVKAGNVPVNFRVNQKVDAAKLAQYFNESHEAYVRMEMLPQTGQMTYVVYALVNNTPVAVGNIYQSHTDFFTGAEKFRVEIKEAAAKKQSMFLTATSIQRLA